MSWNCANGQNYLPHVQSMIFALDRATLQELFLPGIECYADMASAVTYGEIQVTPKIMAAGYDAYALEGRFAAHAGATRKNTTAFLDWCLDGENGGRGLCFGSFASSCNTVAANVSANLGGDDVLYSGMYYNGSTLHPYETM